MNYIYFCRASSIYGKIEYIISAPSEIVCKSLIIKELNRGDWEFLVSDKEIEEGTEKSDNDFLNMFAINMLGQADEKFSQTGIIYRDFESYERFVKF